MRKIILCSILILFSFFSLEKCTYAIENINKVKYDLLKKTYKVEKKEEKLDIKTGNSYNVKCEDVVFLHKYWVVIEILAPILVILFGSLDFLLSVIASNEEKIKAARKKFPKRVIAGVCIFLVFTIISIVLGMSDNSSVENTSLIRCIVNGN